MIIPISKSPIYMCWQDMKKRCNNIKNNRYKNYGARGIKVCDDWFNEFSNFYLWAILNGYEQGLQLDRINTDGNYEPDNCRFVSSEINNQNRTNNKINIQIAEEIRKKYKEGNTQKTLADEFGIDRSMVGYIVRNKAWKSKN